MKLSVLSRKVHYWTSIVIAVPLLIVIVTGLLLQLKKEIPWVQPPEKRGSGKAPTLPFADILAACRTVSEAEIRDWNEIDRLDGAPTRGMIKVQAKNHWEIQLDARSGEVLQVAYRRSDIIESMHDGSWFHELAKHWLFFPTAVALLLLWLTGVYLFWLPVVVKWRR